jgi:hypothetical protein
MVFYYTSYFLKGSFVVKKTRYGIKETFGLFLEGYLSSSLKDN